jgi:hypothetical protein
MEIATSLNGTYVGIGETGAKMDSSLVQVVNHHVEIRSVHRHIERLLRSEYVKYISNRAWFSNLVIEQSRKIAILERWVEMVRTSQPCIYWLSAVP